MEPSTLRVAVTLSLGHHQNSTGIKTIASMIVYVTADNSSITSPVILAINDSQPVNGSFCQIISLEVYRGRRHITEISHNGLLLSGEGVLEVNQMVV